MWHEIDHYSAPLYPYLLSGLTQIGIKQIYSGQEIYIVHDDSRVVYVGKTTRGVFFRLWRHVEKGEPLGEWLRTHEYVAESVSYRIEVIDVSGDLDEAEKHTIASRAPLLNSVQYKNSVTYPPITRHPMDMITLDPLTDCYPESFIVSLFIPGGAGRVYLRERADTIRVRRLYAGSLTRSITNKDVFYLQRCRQYEKAANS